ncbi:hypothetical protein [Halalkalibacter okhensis]|uniref:Uncharacterized protein n=1 Tax=Halalkalibacter okhensis TaxID=333138 RepID=A0A0B0IP28_9BACI|nr:hypothetical protein [Halalkalibacter okhensis]KHF41396.1 hypothetical protein LQ50_03965 [Halalkalibacter okhensis]
MEEILDRFFGFLPQRGVFWTAVGTSLFIVVFHYIISKINELLKLPWMKEENQQQRRQILQKQRNENQK